MIKNILVAEDDRGTGLLLKRQLENYGYRVTVVGNGREALNSIATQAFDLLVTDVVMPEMDGVDLYMALQADPKTRDLPVIIVTDKQMFKDSFAALGVSHFVPKTSEVRVLLEKIRDIEKSVNVKIPRGKVLIGSQNSEVVGKMQELLQEQGCLVSSADNSLDLASRVFLMNPHMILLDIFMKEGATPVELIQALRAFKIFQNMPILIYASVSSSQIAQDSMSLEALDQEIRACLSAGATKYIGCFSRLTFIDMLQSVGFLSTRVSAAL